MSNIMSTMEYDKFNFINGNREIIPLHLRRMKATLTRDNQLAIHPIIVNSKYEIIDGQHRYVAAKELKIPVFYIRSETVSDNHVIECNRNQRQLDLEGYIRFYAKREKNPDYIKLINLLKESKLKPKALLALSLGVINGPILDFVKSGKFRFPNDDQSEKLIKFFLDLMAYFKDRKIKPISMITNFNFTRALRWIYLDPNFDEKKFFDKLGLKWYEIKPQAGAQNWYLLLLNIYNFKNNEKLTNIFEDD